MATSTKAGGKLGPHSPTSNESAEVEATVKKSATRPPAEGLNPKTSKPGAGGVEAVSGFKLNRELAGAMDAVYRAPEKTNLRNIAEASYGPPPPRAETVHGPDDRIRINNTSAYPWRVHASLLITAADNSMWIGTGWFIGPRTLITAGHVVNIRGSGVPGRDGWVRRIQVMPGRNGASLPYGTVTSTSFRSVNGWTGSNGDENFDYGAIILPVNTGNTTGWLGFGNYSDAELLASVGNISGYPGDKPSGTQWYDARRIAAVNPRKVFYDIDTAGGQSGSAVYRIVSGGRYAFGIHAYGGGTTNSGTRINTAVFNNMVAWRA